MPQLVPFYLINQVLFALLVLTIIIYLFSKYILRPLLHRAYNSFILFILKALIWKKYNYLKLIIFAFISSILVSYLLGNSIPELCDPGSPGDVASTQGPSQETPQGAPQETPQETPLRIHGGHNIDKARCFNLAGLSLEDYLRDPASNNRDVLLYTRANGIVVWKLLPLPTAE